jgi:zinc protease
MLPSFGNDASWSMQAILAPQNMVKAEKALLEEIDRVLKDGFTQEELDEAKKGYTDYRAINRSQDGIVASQWIALMKEGRDWTESKENDEKIARLTLKDVNDAFKKMVDPKRLTIILAGDQKKAEQH